MKTNFFSVCLILFLTVSCNQKVQPPQTVDVKDLYSIEIPGNLAKMEDLYEGADLQYGNTFLQTYLVVKDDPKETNMDFNTYVAKAKATYEKRPEYEVLKEDNVKINGLNGKLFELKMNQGKAVMFMIQTIIEGKKANYQIISWTTEKNKYWQGTEMMNAISTFKEI
jgi:hypothetical protein